MYGDGGCDNHNATFQAGDGGHCPTEGAFWLTAGWGRWASDGQRQPLACIFAKVRAATHWLDYSV